MATKLSEIIQKADRESASAAPSFLTKDGASKLKQMQREQEAKDNKLRAEVAKKLNLQDNDETFVQGMYKKIPTNVRLLVENIVGVDSPITAKDFTKEELIEMAFLAEKTRLSNLRTENRYKRIVKSESEKGPPSLEDKDVVDDYKDMIESFEKTRGKTSVNPYIQSNKKIVDANYLDSISKTFTSPSYRIATSLGKYNVYDKDNKELNIKDTYNFNKKERNLPSSFTGALKQMMASPELAGEYLANFLRTEDRDVDINIPKKMNKGGTTMSMNKQMEMFDEGGLKEEGGTVDPVSGNDVPPGSTQEEVRDDIPAQLSEGEFVFPADVVRFIGLEKLMMMRQEAKAGLQRMEDMGQMGNSEEATMPDDMPFDINDLDMEDEQEYNRDSQEMNKGGVIQAATGTFVNQGTGVTSVPSQFAGMNLPSSGTNPAPTYTIPTIPTNVSGYTPKFTAQTGQTNQKVAPTFQTLIGNNPGQYDEMRTYVNDAGQTMDIPFKNGEPIYPIPEGYKFQDPEAIIAEEPTTTTVIPKTTRVVQQDENDDPNKPRTGRITLSDPNNKKTGQKTLEIDLISDSKYSEGGSGYSITDPTSGATVQLLPSEADLLNASGIQSGSLKANTNFKSGVPDVLKPILNRLATENNIISLGKTKAGKELEELLNPDARKNIVEKIFSMSTLKIIADVLSGKASKSKQYEQAVREVQEKIANQPKENQKEIIEETNKLIKDTFEVTDDGDFKQLKGKTDAQKRATPVFNMKAGKVDSVDYGGKTGLSISEYGDIKNKEPDAVAKQERDFAEYQSYQSGDNDSDPNDDYSGDPSPADDDPNMNKGGLAGKKKSKSKKMKRGGLASR